MAGHDQQGSALMLVPAGILILLMLGGISVDSALAFTTQRELANQAAAAANDAVTVSISAAELQKGPAARPDPEVAARTVHESLDGLTIGRLTVRPEDVIVTVDETARTVEVEVRGTVPYIFAGAIPGARGSADVRAKASSELRFSGPGSA